jgi:hypothetical protein
MRPDPWSVAPPQPSPGLAVVDWHCAYSARPLSGSCDRTTTQSRGRCSRHRRAVCSRSLRRLKQGSPATHPIPGRRLIVVSATATTTKIRTTAPISLIDAYDLPNAQVPRLTPPTLSRSIVRSSSPPMRLWKRPGAPPLAAMMPPSSPQCCAPTFRAAPDIFH